MRDHAAGPILAVGNPDIFYLMLLFRYGRQDQRNLFSLPRHATV
ncbi:MAG: hypothetical protein U0821_26965 [Chloroflexota bacterium]